MEVAYRGKEQKNLNNIENKFNRKYVTRHELISSFFPLFDYSFRNKTPIFPKIPFQNLALRNSIYASSDIIRNVKLSVLKNFGNRFRSKSFSPNLLRSSKIRANVENCRKRKNLINFHVGQIDRETMFDKRLKQWTLSLIGSCASRWINPYLADHLVRCPMQLQRLYVDDERTQLPRRNLQLRNGDWTRFFLPSSLSIPAREFPLIPVEIHRVFNYSIM